MSYLTRKLDFLWRIKHTEGTEMKSIQIAPRKMVEDSLVVWNEPGKEVDIVMDLSPYSINFRENSIKFIYAFGLLGRSREGDILNILQNLYKALEPEGQLYIIENDFEYIARGFVGGDLTVQEFNNDFSAKTNLTKDTLLRYLEMTGFVRDNMRVWLDGVKFQKAHYEMVFSAIKKVIK